MLNVFFNSAILLLVIFPNFVLAQAFGNIFTTLTAYFLGDHTPLHNGFLTLNPAKHLDIGGSLVFITVILISNMLLGDSPITSLIFVFLLVSNIRRPIIVPVDEENFKNPILGECATLLARPLGSIFYSFLCLVAIRFLPLNILNFVSPFLAFGAQLGIQFGVLDLIPLPPQAGGRIIQLLIPEDQEDFLEAYSIYGMFIFLGLLLIPGVNNVLFSFIGKVTLGIKQIFMKILFR